MCAPGLSPSLAILKSLHLAIRVSRVSQLSHNGFSVNYIAEVKAPPHSFPVSTPVCWRAQSVPGSGSDSVHHAVPRTEHNLWPIQSLMVKSSGMF